MQYDETSRASSLGGTTLVLPNIKGAGAMLESPRWAVTRRKLKQAASNAARQHLRLLGTGADLDPADLHKVLKGLGVKLTPAELGMLFCAFDANGDGAARRGRPRLSRRVRLRAARTAPARLHLSARCRLHRVEWTRSSQGLMRRLSTCRLRWKRPPPHRVRDCKHHAMYWAKSRGGVRVGAYGAPFGVYA